MNIDRMKYDSFMGRGANRLVHWEHWSNPDAATYITGIDYYEAPRSCMLKLDEMYPYAGFKPPDTGVLADDTPIPRIEDQEDQGHGRWDTSYRDHWQQDVASHRFESFDEMLEFSPLETPGRKLSSCPMDVSMPLWTT